MLQLNLTVPFTSFFDTWGCYSKRQNSCQIWWGFWSNRHAAIILDRSLRIYTPTIPLQNTIVSAWAALRVLVTFLLNKRQWRRLYNLPLHVCLTTRNYHYWFRAFYPAPTFHLDALDLVYYLLFYSQRTWRNTCMCVSLELPLDRNHNFRALRL